MTSAETEHDLSWMISPTDCQSFFQSYFTQVPLRVTRHDPEYYGHLLCEQDLEQVLHTASRVPGAVEELTNTARPKHLRGYPESLTSFHGGKSLRVGGIHRFSRPLIMLCRALEQELSCPTHINMYLTPGQEGAQALDRHYDTHDVFVLQVHGHKKWRVYDSMISFPLEYMPPIRGERQGKLRRRLEKKKEASLRETCKVVDEFTLQAGDLLYLPRGTWHEAEGVAGHTSCHLTVGIQALTYLDLMTIMMTQAAIRNTELRKPLPVGFGTHSDCRSAVRDQVTKIMSALQPHIDSDSALVEVGEIFARSRQAVDGNLLNSSSTPYVGDVGLRSNVSTRNGIICRVYVSGALVSLAFYAVTVSLPLAFEDACRFIARTRHFMPVEIPGNLTDDEKVSLVQRLITDGLLTSDSAQKKNGTESGSEGRGWVPSTIRLRSKRSLVEWSYLGREPFAEPFFKQTIKRLRSSPSTPPTKTAGLKSLLHLTDEILPTGFIFHVSRCGSTLISNALKSLSGTVVISEAQPFGALFAPPDEESGPFNQSADKKDALLRGLVRAYGQMRNGDEKALIIKFSSWAVLSFEIVKRLWPNVPSLFVIRDPIEVMVSCMRQPPGWMRCRLHPPSARLRFGWNETLVAEMSEEQFCARGVGEFFKAGVANVDALCRVVSYENIDASRIEDIAKFFGMAVSPLAGDGIRRSLAIYSKDSSSRKVFLDDRLEKQNSATEVMRRECKQWAEETYKTLKELESW